jgi:hypothetical protein
MADAVDFTSNNDFNEERLRQHQNRKERPLCRGACLFCSKVLSSPYLYCDTDCREDYEREQLLKSKTGRILRL